MSVLHPQLFEVSLTNHTRCAFCQALARLQAQHRDDRQAYYAVEEALWDRYERAALIRQAYGRKHRR